MMPLERVESSVEKPSAPASNQLEQLATDYGRVEAAIAFLDAHQQTQPSLAEVADHVGLSPHHLQRLFKRWAGVTPKQFLQALTAGHAKALLAQSRSTLDASYEAGLSGPGRLHDLMITLEAMTPGEIKRQGEGLTIRYGVHPSPFGACLVATTPRGICALRFLEPGEDGRALLQKEFPRAELREDPATARLVGRIFAPGPPDKPFHLHIKGTNFQLQVWRALLTLPRGALVSYQDVARLVGRDSASRAVAGAIARNPVGYLIPCHRVISQSGAIHGYRWGETRKKALVGWEAARAS